GAGTSLKGLCYLQSLCCPALLEFSRPHFTSCLSWEQETFRCWWTAGNLQNLSQAGALRVFFLNENVSPGGWDECPHYSSEPNQCYFSSRYTSVWTPYCLQLLSASLNVTYDEICFSVEDIGAGWWHLRTLGNTATSRWSLRARPKVSILLIKSTDN
uniref:Growth hormone receptor b n=1 Tax=Paramormyrops kingsleyae TaxID=1676925 RepID=A0A3B3SHF6_9TELE